MKDLFRGYNKKTEKELKVLWENAIFVFDTNVLLNLYRYSEDTRNSIINLVENFKDRVALPYHTAYEFNKNRYEVRSEEHTSELQSRPHLVCRLLLEKKKDKKKTHYR